MPPSKADQLFEAYISRASDSFMDFILGLVVPSGRGPQLMFKCMMEHQRETFLDLAPSLEALRRNEMPPKRRFWIERTKKASKDTDLAACLLWLLAFPTRPMFIQVGAADRDQASIIKRRIDDFIYYNPWLNDLIDVSTYKLNSKNKLVALEIMAADVAGSHGATPDLLICNELSHVSKWEFIQNLLDNADGVPQGIVIIATNAGYRGTEAEKLMRTAQESPLWSCHFFRQPAPWLSPEDIEEARKRNSKARFNRLWYGVWSSSKGDAFDDSLIERCLIPDLQPLDEPQPEWFYLMGLDLGISQDHAALVVLGACPEYPKLRLARMRAFTPNPRTGEVNLMEVEDACLAYHRRFRPFWVGYDPYQAKLMAQRLKTKGVPMSEMTFSGKNLNTMASTLMEVLREGLLEAYDDEDGRLRRDLGKFTILEKSYGYKLESVRDEWGHADVGTALVIALPKAVEAMRGRFLQPNEDLGWVMEDDLTDEEIEAMPKELRDIYEFDYEQEKEKEAEDLLY